MDISINAVVEGIHPGGRPKNSLTIVVRHSTRWYEVHVTFMIHVLSNITK